MKTFRRLFSFAHPIQNFAVPFFVTSILGVIFGLMNFTLLIPIFKLLFNESTEGVPSTLPDFSLSITYFKDLFQYFFQTVIDRSGKLGALRMVCATIVVSVILSNLFKYLSGRIIEDFRLRIVTRLRSAIFQKLTNIDLQYFTTQRKGDIMSRFMTDVVTIQDTIIRSMQVILREPIAVVLNFAILFTISAELTFFALLLIPVSGLLITSIVKRLKKHARVAQESLGMLVSGIEEGLSGVRIIKSFNAEKFMQTKFDNISMHASRVHRRLARRTLLAGPVSETMGVMTVASLLFYGGSLILQTGSDLKGAEFIGYIIIFSQVIQPAKAIADAFGNISQGITAGERVFYLLDAPEKIQDAEKTQPLNSFKDSIEIRNVSFAYGKKKVLSDISFMVGKGQTVALVGPSGGGKTTLLDMLPRFIDPDAGQVMIDGTDIRSFRMADIRSLMGIVNQESILFNDTIFNNIAFGRDATEEEVIEAAKIANAHEFIAILEQGYNTNIGDRGMKLSGGQKQRISIARAVIGNPPILLLDEATSALDTNSEKLVQESLKNLMQNRTSIVIAHRLSTIQDADHIVVIDGGKIVEQGNHQQLLEKKGLYTKLVAMQTFND